MKNDPACKELNKALYPRNLTKEHNLSDTTIKSINTNFYIKFDHVIIRILMVKNDIGTANIYHIPPY